MKKPTKNGKIKIHPTLRLCMERSIYGMVKGGIIQMDTHNIQAAQEKRMNHDPHPVIAPNLMALAG